MSNFNKGDPVEVTKANDSSDCHCYYYPATVVRPPSKSKNLVFVEYLTLFAPSSHSQSQSQTPKRLREYVNVANVRPKVPHQLNPWFKVGDSVDAFRHPLNAWCPATVTDILENSTYLVHFHGSHHHSAPVDHCNLRLHRDWLHGDWAPPLPQLQQLLAKGLSCSKDFSQILDSWRSPLRYCQSLILLGKDRFLIEYRDLTTDDGTQLLKEETNAVFIRPCPPEVPIVGSFKQFQEVDAWDVLKFENSKLRPHQDWIDGKWVMSSKTSSELVEKFGDVMPKAKSLIGNKLILKYRKPSEQAKKPRDVMARTTNTKDKFVLHFCKGADIEVRSDEEGYQGSWYAAIVVDYLQNGKYLVEYLTLKTDDLTEQLKEEADASDIRPYPPDISQDYRFALHEWVDAWYNDGWWVGQVSSVLRNFKYMVYFWPTKEELEFEHYNLRPHQEWIDGRWVGAS
ncbi:Agenet-like domain [Sesbania bispinosa]|nr:Agenet-like domain [Sesbania bispinosa]